MIVHSATCGNSQPSQQSPASFETRTPITNANLQEAELTKATTSQPSLGRERIRRQPRQFSKPQLRKCLRFCVALTEHLIPAHVTSSAELQPPSEKCSRQRALCLTTGREELECSEEPQRASSAAVGTESRNFSCTQGLTSQSHHSKNYIPSLNAWEAVGSPSWRLLEPVSELSTTHGP